MEKKKFCLGIDVSKRKLDCCLFDGEVKKNFKLEENHLKSAKKIVRELDLKKESCLIVMESTGVYHTKAYQSFNALGFDVAVVNPANIKSFAVMKRFKTKTDLLDSYIIAYYGLEQSPKPSVPKSKSQEKMALYLKMIEDLILHRTAFNNKKEALENNYSSTKDMIKLLQDIITMSEKSIKSLRLKLRNIALKSFNDLYRRYQTIPGVGPMVAATIIAYFGNFENFINSKQVVSFCGTCPGIYESGSSVKRRASITRKGNSFIRGMIYLCSLSASRHNKSCADLYKRILEKGKAKKLGLVAVGNKILRQLFGVAKSGLDFNPDYCRNLVKNS